MSRKRMLSVAMASAVFAGVLAVGTPPIAQVGPAQASGTEGWAALGSGMGGIAPAWPGKRVFQIVRTPDGMLFAGGNFTSAGGDTAAANFARYNPTTSAWSPVGGAVAGDVYAVAYDPDPTTGQVWIGGTVTNVSGSAESRLARWSVSTSAWVATPDVSGPGDGVEEIVVVAPNQVYVGGAFTIAGQANADGFTMFNGATLGAVSTGLGAAAGSAKIVNGLTAAPGGVILSGQFISAGGVTANRVAQWDGTNFSAFGGAGFGPPANLVASVVSTSAGVVIGGNFAKVQNANVDVANTKALARWNGTAWESIGSVVGTVVEEMRVIGDYLYVGGEFLAIGGVAASNIARYKLSTATWEAVSHQCYNGVNGVVRSIIDTGLGDGSIYVGGGFTDAGGVAAADGIAKYTPSTLGCSTSGGGSSVLTPPTNFRLAGLVRDRVNGLAGMRAHLAWDVPAGGGGASFFVVTTKGLRGAAGLDESVEHPDLTCVTSEATCSIFFPFTSQVPNMSGRQYHHVIYSMQAYGLFGQSTPLSVGPLAVGTGATADAPRNVRATANWNSVTVTWDEPASFGSAGFATNYLVRSQPGNRICVATIVTFPATASARQCTLYNLRSRVDYTFSVQALTFNGWGADSAPSNRLAQLDLEVTSALRTKPFFALPGTSKIRVSGVASGYAAGTPVRTFMEIGTAGWREVRDANVRVDGSGRILFTRTISPLYARRTVGVRFEIDTRGRCGEPIASAGTCGQSNTEVMRSVW